MNREQWVPVLRMSLLIVESGPGFLHLQFLDLLMLKNDPLICITYITLMTLWKYPLTRRLACVANVTKACYKVKLTEHLYLLGGLNESRPGNLGFESPSGRNGKSFACTFAQGN